MFRCLVALADMRLLGLFLCIICDLTSFPIRLKNVGKVDFLRDEFDGI